MNLGELTRQVLEPLVGSDFIIRFADGKELSLKLTEVSRVMDRVVSSKLKREPFAMYFEAPEQYFLPQAVYPMSNPGLGEEPLEIFIVPIARENGVFHYEAVFT